MITNFDDFGVPGGKSQFYRPGVAHTVAEHAGIIRHSDSSLQWRRWRRHKLAVV